MEKQIDDIFIIMTDFLRSAATSLDMSFHTLCVLLFVIIWPVITIALFMEVVHLKRKWNHWTGHRFVEGL